MLVSLFTRSEFRLLMSTFKPAFSFVGRKLVGLRTYTSCLVIHSEPVTPCVFINQQQRKRVSVSHALL